MKKNYQRPQSETFAMEATQPLLAASIETANLNVYSGESQAAESALVKENPFDFEWE